MSEMRPPPSVEGLDLAGIDWSSIFQPQNPLERLKYALKQAEALLVEAVSLDPTNRKAQESLNHVHRMQAQLP